ncbi:MAG: hypothetical protein ACRDSE_17470 [Pseudonocardiaceae bacterium]
MATTEITELRRTIGQLRQCLGTLRSRYGDAPGVRRLANDLDRLDIDADEFEGAPPVPVQSRASDRSNVVVVPDTPYDESLWAGADDEGVGGYHGQRS